jgi:hypothetical protein
MSVYKVKISTSIADATSGDSAALVPKSSSYPTNAIALTDANNDGWWLSADQSSSNTIGDYDLWVDTGSGYGKVTQTEGLNSWYGNNSIKTHIDAANPHSGSASSSDLTSHIESVSNPHNVTVSQIESESSVTLAQIDDTAGDGDTTVTWSADKLYDRIGVALEDGNIISANSSHAVAITALDAAIENISATGNTTGTSLSNTIYANSREQIVSGGGSDYYSFAGTSDFLPFKKDSNATKIRVSFEGKIEDITGGAPGNISLEGGKLNAAGTGLTTDSVISSFKYLTSMSYTSYELEDNISNFSSGINVIKIKLNPDSTYDLYIRNVVVDVV